MVIISIMYAINAMDIKQKVYPKKKFPGININYSELNLSENGIGEKQEWKFPYEEV